MTRQTKEELARLKREYRKENREKVIEQNKKSYLKNRDKRLTHDKEYYNENKKTILERQRKYAQNNKEKKNLVAQKYRNLNPQKIIARRVANYYIKIPENKVCEECKINKATDKHHEDYNKPLDVQFICHPCNSQIGGVYLK